MYHKLDLLVIVLDGLSYVFTNTFMWFGQYMQKLWKLDDTKRSMLYIDVLPETPYVANTFFRLDIYVNAGRNAILPHYIWEYFRDLRIQAFNIPVSIPTCYFNVSRPRKWIDYFVLPKERFDETINEFHEYVKNNINSRVTFVWYMIPDQAHHYFFPTIHDYDSLKKAIKYYDMACRLALDLIQTFKPSCWIILSDHGFTSDVRDTVIESLYHIRDGIAITNCGEPPRKASEVIYWLYKNIIRLKSRR